MHTYTIACCATRIGQLQLSAGCSEYCRMHGLVQGLCNMATQPYRLQACLTASTHANRHAHLYSSVLQLSLCSCGCLQSILVTVCTGFVQHVLKPGTACKVHYTDATFQIGAVMSASMLGSLSCSAGVCCCLLVVALLLPAQGLCQANTARYSLLVCLTASTRKQACIRTYVHQQVLQLELVSSRCLALF
jgi:hypothetical protein